MEKLECRFRLHPWPELIKELPPLFTEEKEALKESIMVQGLKYSVKALPDGRIIDGYHRWLVLGEKTPFEVIDVDEETALGIARVLNIARRQLSFEQVNAVYQRIKPLALKFRKDGHTQAETAKRFGVSQQVISRWEGQEQKASATNTTLGISCKPRRRGTLKIKIPKGEYEVIYNRSKAGESQEQIASDYKVSQQSISKIIRKVAEKKEKEKQAEETKLKNARLILGDFRQVQSQIDAQSIDLIFTDSPYGEEYLDLWGGDLGKFALRKLFPFCFLRFF